jgi:hypothetical protein
MKGAEIGEGVRGRSLKKQLHASWDLHSKKAKQAVHTRPVMMEEQKAAAYTKKFAKCCGILLPHSTDWGLGKGVQLPDPDTEGTQCHGDICILDEVLNMYVPLQRDIEFCVWPASTQRIRAHGTSTMSSTSTRCITGVLCPSTSAGCW